MSSFLFTTMPATGHVMPKLPIARELVARGHEVRWYTGAYYREQVQATGAIHHPIESAADFGGQTIGEAFPELVGLTGIAMVRKAFQRVFIDNAEGMLRRDCQAILSEHPADAILSEPLFVASRWVHELGGRRGRRSASRCSAPTAATPHRSARGCFRSVDRSVSCATAR